MLKNSIIVEAYFQWMEDNGDDLNQSPDYKKIADEFDRILRELEQHLPEDKKNLSFDLDSLIGLMVLYETKRSYYYGFIDGAKLIIDINS